jgi:hypothetical protein
MRKKTVCLVGILGVSTVLALAAGCVASGPPPPHSDPYGRYDRPYYPPRDARYGYRQEEFARLAHELEDRAARAHEIAEESSPRHGPREQEFFTRIHHFSDQAYRFHRRYEEGDIRDPRALREELQHLLDDARETDRSIRQASVFREVWNEWQGVLRVLQRMIDMVR